MAWERGTLPKPWPNNSTATTRLQSRCQLWFRPALEVNYPDSFEIL
jgi:hypothetical protein